MKDKKQYRLKRWYPSLKKTVEVGCIITKIYTCGGYHYRGSDNEGVIFYVSGSQCENNPDFWELIEDEKPKPLFITEEGLEEKDGEVNVNELKIKALLEGLEAQNIEEFMREAKVVDYRNYGKAYVSAARNKIKESKPLFITDDGVEVLSDIDNLYAVNLTYFNKTKNTLRHSSWLIENSAYKVFYHEANADEYIWRNMRLFSYEDVVEWYGYGFKLGREGIYETLERLAKERSE